MPDPPFHIVLLSPEIPNNTGNIGRTAAATGCRLHIVHPIAFDMSEKALRRAGLDYWHLVDCREHDSWESFLETEHPPDKHPPGKQPPGKQPPDKQAPRVWLYTTKTDRPHWEASFQRGDYLLFGNETKGVATEIHDWMRRTHGDSHRITLPMVDDPRARSLNLATAVCAAVYEGLRQIAL